MIGVRYFLCHLVRINIAINLYELDQVLLQSVDCGRSVASFLYRIFTLRLCVCYDFIWYGGPVWQQLSF